MQYKVLHETFRDFLERDVQQHLEKGWELPPGSSLVVAVDNSGKGHFYREVVKYDNPFERR